MKMVEKKAPLRGGAIPEERTPVLAVGGGLTGLSTAVFLGAHGVAGLVVGRHPGLLIHPRARGFNPRTVELYRQVGLEPAMLAARNFAGDPSQLLILCAETLASEEYGLIKPGVEEHFEELSPSRLCLIDQGRLEVLLRDRAGELGAEVRFATEMVSLQQDADGVHAVTHDLRTGIESTVYADYLVVTDGYRSQIREQLAIPTRGPGAL
jgi:putative polyketide hydroxylase